MRYLVLAAGVIAISVASVSAQPKASGPDAAAIAKIAADAVPLGDYHYPHMVAWAFIGRPRGSDEQMLELLEPFAGHRGRVLRLLLAAGLSAPRYGPRMSLRSIERI